MLRAAALVALLGGAAAFLPAQNPPWGAVWHMNGSTITMACNQSGWFDPVLASQFGIASFDWSNNKATWAAAKPMSTQETLLAQAAMVQAVSTNAFHRTFSYFNLVKALPWYTSVREKLADPAYSGWFLRFNFSSAPHVPPCDPVTGECSSFYHDQSQTPAVPTPAQPNPDGKCVGFCDCGPGIPCGEYLWDHRNATLRPWLIQLLLGPDFVGASNASLFIDDFWCSNQLNGTGSCTDPAQGPTEVEAHSVLDMGLSDSDVADITRGWLQTMTEVQAAIVGAGGYTWSLMPGQDNANASPFLLTKGNCAASVRSACRADSTWQTAPLLMGVTPGPNTTQPFAHFTEDLAGFLLMRGPNAYMGWGEWGLSWPVGESWSNGTTDSLPLPAEFHADFGEPTGLCVESAPGVFTRPWTKLTQLQLDCNTFQGIVTPAPA